MPLSGIERRIRKRVMDEVLIEMDLQIREQVAGVAEAVKETAKEFVTDNIQAALDIGTQNVEKFSGVLSDINNMSKQIDKIEKKSEEMRDVKLSNRYITSIGGVAFAAVLTIGVAIYYNSNLTERESRQQYHALIQDTAKNERSIAAIMDIVAGINKTLNKHDDNILKYAVEAAGVRLPPTKERHSVRVPAKKASRDSGPRVKKPASNSHGFNEGIWGWRYQPRG